MHRLILVLAYFAYVANTVIDRTFVPRDLVPKNLLTNKGLVRFDLNKAALVIIDMQVYFLKDGMPGLALIPRMNATIAAFREAGSPIIWVNWGQRSDMRNFPGTWKPPIHGTPDAQIYPGTISPTCSAISIRCDRHIAHSLHNVEMH